MLKITINDPSNATLAGDWCSKQFNSTDWDLNARDLFSNSPKYDFIFAKEPDAIFFSLKWLSA